MAKSINRLMAELINDNGAVRGDVLTNAEAAIDVYTALDSLPSTGLSSGDQAWVESSGRLYISNGSGWYNVALVNATPTLTLDQSGTIQLNADTLSVTVTATATDTDDNQDMITFSVESDGNMVGTGTTLSQDSSVFTITADSEGGNGVAGEFTLTFKATDQIAVDNETLDFRLSFVTYQSLISKALWVHPLGSTTITNLSTKSGALDTGIDAIPSGVTVVDSDGPNSLGALLFDGTASIELADGGFHGSGNFITTASWIKLTSLDDQVFFSDGGGGNGFCLNLENSTMYYGGSVSDVQYSATYSVDSDDLNVWVHVLGIIDKPNGTIKIYKDGTLQNTYTKGSAFGDFNGSNSPFLGSSDITGDAAIPTTDTVGTNSKLSSYIADLYIFDSAITADEIASLSTAAFQLDADSSTITDLTTLSTPDATHSVNDASLYSAQYTGDLTLQCTIPFPSSLSSGVYNIWEAGGSGHGAALGVEDGKLFWTCGIQNGILSNDTTANFKRCAGKSTLNVPTDGQLHLVTVLFDHSLGSVEVYIGTTEYISSSVGDFGTTYTYGGDEGSYLADPQTSDTDHPLNEGAAYTNVLAWPDTTGAGTMARYDTVETFPVETTVLIEPS